MKRPIAWLLLFASLAGASVRAQTAEPRKIPSFDVVSVRVNNTGDHAVSIDVEKNSYTATNATLMKLINEAYGIKNDLISGAPGWASVIRYDVQAKVLDGENVDLERLTDKEFGPILQALLAERFQLKTHVETKTLPVYELLAAKGGSKLKATAVPPGADQPPRDGDYIVHHGSLDGHGMTMASVASVLSEALQRKVIDKTGLTGSYDVALAWTPDEDATGAPADAPPSIFIAVQEQLGLKLQAGRGPVPTLVLDHVEKPSEN